MNVTPACSETNGGVHDSVTALQPLHPSDQWVPIGTGNYYKGGWNHRTMSGYGVYVTPNDTVYEGNVNDGLFHGTGTMYYPSGSRIEGVWEKGKCAERNYIFSDGLRFRPDDWQYCKMPDRRFATEYLGGLAPAAKSRITNLQPTINVPDGMYDAGDGFYQPLTNTVHDYRSNKLIRTPTVEGGQWIVKNCRRGGDRVVGFRPELYENWYKKTENACNDDCSYTFQKDKGALSKPIVCNDLSTMMADVKSPTSTLFDLKCFWSRRRGPPSPDRLPPSTSVDDQPNYCQKTVLRSRSDDDDRSSVCRPAPN